MESVKVFVVGGPGFAKKRFVEKIRNISSHESDLKLRSLIEKHSKKFITVQTSSTFKDSINEILKDPTAKK